MTIKCPNCGNLIMDGTDYCPSCGQTFTVPASETQSYDLLENTVILPIALGDTPDHGMTCPSCGEPITSNMRFCRNCGYNLTAPAAEPVVEPITAAVPATETPTIEPLDHTTELPAAPEETPDKELVCPSCGEPITPGMRFCRNCGYDLMIPVTEPVVEPITAAVPATETPTIEPLDHTTELPAAPEETPDKELVCPSCGEPITPGMRFCRNCGYDLMTPVTEPVVEPIPVEEPPVVKPIPETKPDKKPAPVPGPPNTKPAGSQTAPVSEPSKVSKPDRSKIIIFILLAVIALLAALLLGKGCSTSPGPKPAGSESSDSGETTETDPTDDPGTEQYVDLSDAINDIRFMGRLLNGKESSETGMYEHWYEDSANSLFGYGNYPGNTTVDDFWIYDTGYSLFGVYVGQSIEDAASELKLRGWKVNMESSTYNDYVLGDDTVGLLLSDGKVMRIDFTREYTKEDEHKVEEDKEPAKTNGVIGTAYVKVNRIRKRSGPSLNASYGSSRANKGDVYDVYEIVTSQGYTWYRIGASTWIADQDGKWIRYTAN